ncbi:hypothetical protein SPOG_03095 [Schizosaccharomyces cryophilus OY26]|uniref:Uncharacterized protein n=1 Tax=Schizosaccharomyces cryophilus (strain OY26 / ATCC MYA-4695 / CBS 11777 / NBRC 106824 / NRRL Y48691) TaxID=653667 RepID=S9X8Z6_SCHCR|nr:uncharacterized protein SPOG_03095 [Schizosaccharomyces cryophilus OY26]EPY53672.1 hypothetical protein SPOG_03095 [Schizosaccharomyces cryophilus OY26]
MKRSGSLDNKEMKRKKNWDDSKEICLLEKEVLEDNTETKKRNLHPKSNQSTRSFLLNDKNTESDCDQKPFVEIPVRGPFPAVKEMKTEDEGLRGFHSNSVLRTCFRVGELLKVYSSRLSTYLTVVEFFGKVRSHKCVGNIILLELEDVFRGSKSPCIHAKLYSTQSVSSFLLETGSFVRIVGNAACSEKLLKIMHISSTDMDELIETYNMTHYQRT